MAYNSKGSRLAQLVQGAGTQPPTRGMLQATRDALIKKKERDEELRLLVRYEAMKRATERRQFNAASGKENKQSNALENTYESLERGKRVLTTNSWKVWQFKFTF